MLVAAGGAHQGFVFVLLEDRSCLHELGDALGFTAGLTQ